MATVVVDAAPLGEAEWATVLSFRARVRALRQEGPRQSTRRRAFVEDLNEALATTNAPLTRLYLSLVAESVVRPLTLAQMGQSLDGRVATAKSQCAILNGTHGLDHLHRLRALVDAVIVGASTVATDDPHLTTRRVRGESPVRVVIDPRRRLAPGHRLFDGSAPTLIVCRAGDDREPPAVDIDIVGVPGPEGEPLPPRAILSALRRRGLRTLLVEGGPLTVSAFLAAGVIDRLHLVIAPLILGAGPCAFVLPSVATVEDAVRLDAAMYPLGGDVLFDLTPCDDGAPVRDAAHQIASMST